ncbi:MAG: acyl-CoA thioesterase [Firmicutes bacterium]|uniref:Thioesterase-3 n=1 Tax=Melghirimyces thermohalophilus TaxID=1236220 RepID=A0A1G6K0G6_9BACL|nr:acyl-CoA thioesterase [Melghirimyces thermohalophilus]MDA8353077.1 acyl-CoA thioesterase [Bacillota bacterium]SDC24388.1 thioesterase-3 [Melghirimyces thermohalophilus]
METSITIEVRPTEIDVMGHVNNAKYLEYMEWGREDWYNRANLSFDRFTEMNVGTVTVNININYRKEARQGEQLTIKTRPLRKGRSSYVLEHVIENEQGDRVADAEVVSVTIDLKERRSVPMPEELARQFS